MHGCPLPWLESRKKLDSRPRTQSERESAPASLRLLYAQRSSSSCKNPLPPMSLYDDGKSDVGYESMGDTLIAMRGDESVRVCGKATKKKQAQFFGGGAVVVLMLVVAIVTTSTTALCEKTPLQRSLPTCRESFLFLGAA